MSIVFINQQKPNKCTSTMHWGKIHQSDMHHRKYLFYILGGWLVKKRARTLVNIETKYIPKSTSMCLHYHYIVFYRIYPFFTWACFTIWFVMSFCFLCTYIVWGMGGGHQIYIYIYSILNVSAPILIVWYQMVQWNYVYDNQ